MAQINAYKRLINRYDDAITGRRWWSRMYMRGLWGVDYCKIAEDVLSMIPDNMDGRLLDIPVGSSVFTIEKYKRMTRCEIFGVDYSAEMIEMSKIHCKEEKVDHLHLMQGDVLELNFKDAYFDCVMTMNGVQSFPDNDRAFAEMYRVLKPGGIMCGSFYIKGYNLLADWIAHHPLERKGVFIAPHYTEKEAREKLTELFGDKWSAQRVGSVIIFGGVK